MCIRDRFTGKSLITRQFFINSILVTGDPAGRHGVTLVKNLTSTASDSTLNITRGWIEFCNLHHQCVPSVLPLNSGADKKLGPPSSSENAVNVPKRLIDLMAFGRHSLHGRQTCRQLREGSEIHNAE